MRSFGKIGGKSLVETLKSEMKSKEQNESDRKVQESLDHFIRHTIGKESFLSYSRPGENPVQWVQWLESLDQQSVNKLSKGSKVEAGLDAKEGGQKENVTINRSSADLNAVKESIHNNMKGTGTFGRGLQTPTQRMHSLKIQEAVVAVAQAAAKANGEPEKYLPGWPLLSPKVQMLKCEKCSQEFCSPLNHRRHTRMHRRPLNVEKEDLRKERANLVAFWNKLSTDEAKQIVSFKNIMLKDVPGASIVRALSSFIQQPGLASLPQFYLKAGAALLDVVQIKSSKFPLPAEDLFSILDDASERTFLCAGTSLSVQRLVFEGEAGKMGLEGTNLVASLGFLVEQRLVNAWIVDKDAEALRCQKELVEEEEAVQKKQAELLERKRLKKLRQKESREKERKVDDQASAVVAGSVDGGGNSPVLGDADDSLTAVESSSPSTSSSAQDLGNQEQTGDIGNLDVQSSEGVECKILRLLGKEFMENSSSLIDESAGQIPVGEGHSHLNKDLSTVGESDEAHNTNNLGINDSDLGSRAPHVSAAQVSLVSLPHFINKEGEQDKSCLDYNGRAGMPFDRKLMRGWRERRRYVANDSASYQKHPYDPERRLSDTNTQSSLKLMRKSCNGFLSGQDSLGVAALPKTLPGDRSEKYRDVPLGRRMQAVGNGYKMWTRKTQQTSNLDSCNALNSKSSEVRTDGTCASKVGELTQLPPDACSNGPTCEGHPVVEMKGSDVTIVETGSSEGDNNVTIPVFLANDENDSGYKPDQKIPDGEFLIGSMCVSLNKFSDGVRQPRLSGCTNITDGKQREPSSGSQHKPHVSTSDPHIWSEISSRADGEIHETVSNCFSEFSKEHSTVLNGFVTSSPVPNKEDHTKIYKPHDNFSCGGDSPQNSCGHLVGHEKFARQNSRQNGVNKNGMKVWRLVGELHDSHVSAMDALGSVQDSEDIHNLGAVLDFEAQAAIGSNPEFSLKQDTHISGNITCPSVILEEGISTGEIQQRKEDTDNDSCKGLKLAAVGSFSNGRESQCSNGLTRIHGSSEYILNDKMDTVDHVELKFSLACDHATSFLSQRWEDAIVDPGAIVIPNADSGVMTDTNDIAQVYSRDLGSPDRRVTDLSLESVHSDSLSMSDSTVDSRVGHTSSDGVEEHNKPLTTEHMFSGSQCMQVGKSRETGIAVSSGRLGFKSERNHQKYIPRQRDAEEKTKS